LFVDDGITYQFEKVFDYPSFKGLFILLDLRFSENKLTVSRIAGTITAEMANSELYARMIDTITVCKPDGSVIIEAGLGLSVLS
jgi:hypothetical protein